MELVFFSTFRDIEIVIRLYGFYDKKNVYAHLGHMKIVFANIFDQWLFQSVSAAKRGLILFKETKFTCPKWI